MIGPAVVFDYLEWIYVDDLTSAVRAGIDIQVGLNMGMPMEHQAWACPIDERIKGLKTCVCWVIRIVDAERRGMGDEKIERASGERVPDETHTQFPNPPLHLLFRVLV